MLNTVLRAALVLTCAAVVWARTESTTHARPMDDAAGAGTAGMSWAGSNTTGVGGSGAAKKGPDVADSGTSGAGTSRGRVGVSRHVFYRSMAGAVGGGSRRVFGGAAATLRSLPGACVLLDRYWATRCSGAVLSLHWVVTAAHCVRPELAYIMYNTRSPNSLESEVAAVAFLYRHPDYTVLQEDEGHGIDVTQLHHDVGLLRTRKAMQLLTQPKVDPLGGMRRYDLKKLEDEEVQVLGFGRTEHAHLGEQLFEVRLRLVGCERTAWEHCMCGVGMPMGRGGVGNGEGGARGVCSGDSGGPVVYRGVQVGVTSMGPLECAASFDPPESATSVFTSLNQYADLLNATMHDTPTAQRMIALAVPSASAARDPAASRAPAATGAALLALAVRVAS